MAMRVSKYTYWRYDAVEEKRLMAVFHVETHNTAPKSDFRV